MSSFYRVSNNDENTNDFTINLTGNYKYLLLKVVANYNWFTIVNKKNGYDYKNETYKNQTYSSDKENKPQSKSDTKMDKKVTTHFNTILMIIIISFSSFIVIAIISVIICCVCHKRSGPDYASRIDSPLMPSYPGVQPQPQFQPQSTIYTQPGYQPYVVQTYYP